MTKDNECYAYFTVAGDFDPARITAQIGLQPTDSWIKGSRNEKTHLERKSSRWNLYSRLDRSTSLEEHVEDLVEQLESYRVQIIETARNFNAYISLVGYFHASFPGLAFDASLISRLGVLNLGLDCDFYYLYSDKREDS